MSRDSFVSDGLYNITKKSAAAPAKPQENEFNNAESSPNFSGAAATAAPAAPAMDKKTKEVLTAAMVRRFDEYGHTRKSLVERLNAISETLKEEKTSSEERLEKIGKILAEAEERLERLSSEAGEINEIPSIEKQGEFADRCRNLDNLHIECVRLAAAYEAIMRSGAKLSSSDASGSAKASNGIDLDSLTFGQLFRMGFIASLPLALTIIAGAVIVAAGVIAAFNGTFHW